MSALFLPRLAQVVRPTWSRNSPVCPIAVKTAPSSSNRQPAALILHRRSRMRDKAVAVRTDDLGNDDVVPIVPLSVLRLGFLVRCNGAQVGQARLARIVVHDAKQ